MVSATDLAEAIDEWHEHRAMEVENGGELAVDVSRLENLRGLCYSCMFESDDAQLFTWENDPFGKLGA
jgi:hypothetical protein